MDWFDWPNVAQLVSFGTLAVLALGAWWQGDLDAKEAKKHDE